MQLNRIRIVVVTGALNAFISCAVRTDGSDSTCAFRLFIVVWSACSCRGSWTDSIDAAVVRYAFSDANDYDRRL